jgi:DNA-binding transcriptional LysR family regulator
VLEADNELVIRSLVVSGVGVALIREDLALAAAAENQVVLWEPAHIETALQFIWSRARTSEAPLGALIDVVQQTWQVEPPPVESLAA